MPNPITNNSGKSKHRHPHKYRNFLFSNQKVLRQTTLTVLKWIFSPIAIFIALLVLPFAVIFKTAARLFRDFDYKGLYGVIVSAEFFLLCGVLLVLYLLCIPIWGDSSFLYWPLREIQHFYSSTDHYQYDPYALISTLFLGFVALIFTVKQSEIANISLEQSKPKLVVESGDDSSKNRNVPVFSVSNKGSSDAFNIRIYYKKQAGAYRLLKRQQDCILQPGDSYCIRLDNENINTEGKKNLYSFILSYQNSATKRPYLYGTTVIFDAEKLFLQPVGLPILYKDNILQSPIGKEDFSEMSRLQQFYSRPSNYPDNFSERISHMIENNFKTD